MKLNKILCLIPTFKEKPSKTVESLENQSQVETEIVVVGAYPSSEIDGVKFVLSTPNMRESVGIRVAKALNYALGRVNIIDFDYVAKFDDDVILPNAFLYENTRSGYDFIGEGPAMLFKPRRFKAITGGRLTVTNRDDTYLIAQFTLAGFPPKEWIVPPINTRPDHHTIRGDYLAGVDCFGRGVIPNPSNIIHQPAMLAGYLHGWIIGYELPIKHWRRERLRWIKRTRSSQDN